MRRKDGESFNDYKVRRKEDRIATKAALKPRQLWNSAEKGTYVVKVVDKLLNHNQEGATQ